MADSQQDPGAPVPVMSRHEMTVLVLYLKMKKLSEDRDLPETLNRVTERLGKVLLASNFSGLFAEVRPNCFSCNFNLSSFQLPLEVILHLYLRGISRWAGRTQFARRGTKFFISEMWVNGLILVFFPRRLEKICLLPPCLLLSAFLRIN